jgi:hypothetical protein
MLVLAVVFVVGCGGDDDGTSDPEVEVTDLLPTISASIPEAICIGFGLSFPWTAEDDHGLRSLMIEWPDTTVNVTLSGLKAEGTASNPDFVGGRVKLTVFDDADQSAYVTMYVGSFGPPICG